MKRISITYYYYYNNQITTKHINYSLSHYISALYKIQRMRKWNMPVKVFWRGFKALINNNLQQVLFVKQGASLLNKMQLFNCLHAFGYFIFHDLFPNSNPIKHPLINKRFILCDYNHAMSFHYDASSSKYKYNYNGKHCKASFSYNSTTQTINIVNNSYVIDVIDPTMKSKNTINYEKALEDYNSYHKTLVDYIREIGEYVIVNNKEMGIKIVLSAKDKHIECDDICEIDGFYIYIMDNKF